MHRHCGHDANGHITAVPLHGQCQTPKRTWRNEVATPTVAVPAAGNPDVIERPNTRETEGHHDRFSHYVNKTALTRSAVSGEAVVALCGKKWVPSRDGERYPVCPACKEIYAGLRS